MGLKYGVMDMVGNCWAVLVFVTRMQENENTYIYTEQVLISVVFCDIIFARLLKIAIAINFK